MEPERKEDTRIDRQAGSDRSQAGNLFARSKGVKGERLHAQEAPTRRHPATATPKGGATASPPLPLSVSLFSPGERKEGGDGVSVTFWFPLTQPRRENRHAGQTHTHSALPLTERERESLTPPLSSPLLSLLG